MIYLYRFEVRTADADNVSGQLNATLSASMGFSRQVYCLTNYERPLSLSTASMPVPYVANVGFGAPGAFTYSPERVSHDGIRLDSEGGAGSLTVTLPAEHPLAALFSEDAPSSQVWLTLGVMETPAAEPLCVYVGRVRAVEFEEHVARLSLMPWRDVLKRRGLTQLHARGATGALRQHAYNGPNAVGSYFFFREDGIVQSIAPDRLSVVVPEAANRPDFWDGGLAIIGGAYSTLTGPTAAPYRPGGDFFARAVPADVNALQSLSSAVWSSLAVNGGTRRAIVGHDGTVLRFFLRLPPSVSPGTRVTLYCGVPADKAAYAARFGDLRRYNGYPDIPVKNPYTTGIKP